VTIVGPLIRKTPGERRKTMNWKRDIAVTSILLFALVLGCAGGGGYGKMRVEEGGGMTPETLVNNWQNYDIYWAGTDQSTAIAVLFDPKNDGKTLQMGPRWGRASDQVTVNKMVGLIKQTSGSGGFVPRLFTILGPDGSTFGYVYTVINHLVINVIDEKTMLVESLT
jgi:hypothetical protein